MSVARSVSRSLSSLSRSYYLIKSAPFASMSATETSLKVLVLGGGYGSLAAGLNLLDLCQGKTGRFYQTAETKSTTNGPKIPIKVKFVDERDGYYHLIGSPLALASETYAKKAFVKYDELPAFKDQAISWAQGTAVKIDAERKVASIKDSITGKTYEEIYDYLIAGTGLKRDWPAVPQSVTRETYLAEAGAHIEGVANARDGVVVIGGGAVGIEMAAEIALTYPELKVTLVHSRDRLLSAEPLPDDFKDQTVELLRKQRVEVVLGKRVKETESTGTQKNPSYKLTLSDGSTLTAGHVIFAVSRQAPIAAYLPKEALDQDGYVKVSPTMELLPNLANHSSHYAIGDICSWSGIKRCGAAMSMGYHAAFNIHQKLAHQRYGIEPKYMLFPVDVPPMIAIAVGNTGIMHSPVDGTTSGEAVLEMMFRDDLGFAICWNYLQLGIDPTVPAETRTVKDKGKDVEVEVAIVEATSELQTASI